MIFTTADTEILISFVLSHLDGSCGCWTGELLLVQCDAGNYLDQTITLDQFARNVLVGKENHEQI